MASFTKGQRIFNSILCQTRNSLTMAKIYSVPEGITVPEISFTDFKEYEKKCDEFVKELEEWVKKRKPVEEFGDELVGEIIRFPVADGNAEYMVASSKGPVELIHLPLMDAWHFEYAHRLTSKDVREKVAQQKRIEKLFSRKKGE